MTIPVVNVPTMPLVSSALESVWFNQRARVWVARCAVWDIVSQGTTYAEAHAALDGARVMWLNACAERGVQAHAGQA